MNFCKLIFLQQLSFLRGIYSSSSGILFFSKPFNSLVTLQSAWNPYWPVLLDPLSSSKNLHTNGSAAWNIAQDKDRGTHLNVFLHQKRAFFGVIG